MEHEKALTVCAICSDERQWVPAAGQKWATLEELAQAGRRVHLAELELNLYGITVEPKVGIGQQTHLVRTPAGNLLWDPGAAAAVRRSAERYSGWVRGDFDELT